MKGDTQSKEPQTLLSSVEFYINANLVSLKFLGHQQVDTLLVRFFVAFVLSPMKRRVCQGKSLPNE